MFAAMLKELKNSGKSETEHTKPLSADDLNMCREYFSENIDQPEELQMYVWFVITLCLGLRGREKTEENDQGYHKKYIRTRMARST